MQEPSRLVIDLKSSSQISDLVRPPDEETHREKLKDQVNHLEQEARMVLPGIQALFGFQFVAVFNPSFKSTLAQIDQNLHWLALGMTALATLLMLAPAAYHRQTEPDFITKKFVGMANRCITFSMGALMTGLCIDFFVIGSVISGGRSLSLLISTLLFVSFATLWFVFPQIQKRRLGR